MRNKSDLTKKFRSVPECVVAAVLSTLAAACVQTADCDSSVPCESGQICYDYVCRPTCTPGTDECGGGSACVPCQQDDASGTVDHCFDSTAFACVVVEMVE